MHIQCRTTLIDDSHDYVGHSGMSEVAFVLYHAPAAGEIRVFGTCGGLGKDSGSRAKHQIKGCGGWKKLANENHFFNIRTIRIIKSTAKIPRTTKSRTSLLLLCGVGIAAGAGGFRAGALKFMAGGVAAGIGGPAT
jgi:hypothetical protein